ncbi:hypothetical protein [Streptomyces sp. NPDC058279]|uniref:hypothetical protein n=1 Tax=Streptomyces sp. NPDC058279 TaxID=3346418 RepID=UPI0036EEDE33
MRKLNSDLKRRKGTSQSVEYLVSNAEILSRYGSIDDLAVEHMEGDSTLKGLVHHLSVVRWELGRELWSRRFFVGPSALDDILYHVLTEERSEDPLLRCLEIIRDNRVARPGIIIFPVHSFGVLGGGLMRLHRERRWSFAPPEADLVIFTQTNEWCRTLERIDNARRSLGIGKQIPADLLEHWRKSRDLAWLERNPVMIMRARIAPGSYYDTEFFALGRLQAGVTLVCMLAMLQPNRNHSQFAWTSSSRLNNRETRDIHHYINLFEVPDSKRTLKGDCVPINRRKAALSDMSELNVEIDPRYWQRYNREAARVRAAVDAVYEGHMRHVVLRRPGRDTAQYHAFKKLNDSQSYFRRSFHASEEGWSSVISLATAFEMMLTDGVSKGKIADRLRERVGLLLKGTRGVRSYSDSVHALYKARNVVVHSGVVPPEVDLDTAKETYVRCFIAITERMHTLHISSLHPMRDICEAL